MARRKVEQPAAMAEVAARVTRWRATKQKGSRMPEELWREAVSLARVHGIYRVVRGLRIDYQSLKKRLGMASSQGAAARSSGFVELDGAQLIGARHSAPTVVELLAADGMKLTIQLPSEGAVDVLALAEAFCRRGA